MFKTVLAACVVLCAFIVHADARPRHHIHHRVIVADPGCNVLWPCEGVTTSVRGERIARKMGFGSAQKVYTPPTIVAHPAGCPARAFCGCGAAVRLFGAPVRSLWLAANWFRFPRAAPAPGMAAVRRHHVFVLERHIEGSTWLAYDANSGGHATRIHARSIAGYVIVDPHGAG